MEEPASIIFPIKQLPSNDVGINRRMKPSSCFQAIRSSSQPYVKSETGVNMRSVNFCVFFFLLKAYIFIQITPHPNCILIPKMTFFYIFLHSREFFGNESIVNVHDKSFIPLSAYPHY